MTRLFRDFWQLHYRFSEHKQPTSSFLLAESTSALPELFPLSENTYSPAQQLEHSSLARYSTICRAITGKVCNPEYNGDECLPQRGEKLHWKGVTECSPTLHPLKNGEAQRKKGAQLPVVQVRLFERA